VFITDVEAGPVALLATGILFAVIAMGHRSWRTRFDQNEIEQSKLRRDKRSSGEVIAQQAAASDHKSPMRTRL
jgi:hypothetical protein